MFHLPQNINDLVEVMNRLCYNPTMAELQDCFTTKKRFSTGKDSDKNINIVNFVNLIFKAYDKDNNGYISSDEWSEALNKMSGSPISGDQATEIFKLEKYDLNGDGKLSFEEFVSYMYETHTTELTEEQKSSLKSLFPDNLDIKLFFESMGIDLTESDLDQIKNISEQETDEGITFEHNSEKMCKALFTFTDKNNDGYVSASEMQNLIEKIMGGNVSVGLEDVSSLIAAVDENDDGKLSYAEFICMFIRLAEWKESLG